MVSFQSNSEDVEIMDDLFHITLEKVGSWIGC